jgi:hypothetical protein
VGGRRYRRQIVQRRLIDNNPAQPREIVAYLHHVAADACTDLDLRSQQLRANLALCMSLTIPYQVLGWVNYQAAAAAIDQQVFFFYAQCKRGLALGHVESP